MTCKFNLCPDKHTRSEQLIRIPDFNLDSGLPGAFLQKRGNTNNFTGKSSIRISIRGNNCLLTGMNFGVVFFDYINYCNQNVGIKN